MFYPKHKRRLSLAVGLLALLGLATLSTGCSDAPLYSTTPEIRFVRFQNDTVPEFETIRITFGYQDGDGDLGLSVPDTNRFDLFITDTRQAFRPPQAQDSVFRYNLPYLTPEARIPSIKGEITINIEGGSPVFNPGLDSESFPLRIQIRDRAGNLSNVVTTPPLTIIR
jgi:hypothetical protein